MDWLDSILSGVGDFFGGSSSASNGSLDLANNIGSQGGDALGAFIGANNNFAATSTSFLNTIGGVAKSLFGNDVGKLIVGSALTGYSSSQTQKAENKQADRAYEQRDKEQQLSFEQQRDLRMMDQDYSREESATNREYQSGLLDKTQQFQLGTIGVNHQNNKETLALQQQFQREMSTLQQQYAMELAKYTRDLDKENRAIRLGNVKTIREA